MGADITDFKRRAAEKAVEFIESGMIVGLGTGSTAVHATRAIGRMLASGRLKDVRGIPTSDETMREAQALAIPLTTFEETSTIDVTIDGADEIDPNLDLIKGLGGALLREKIVATASRQFIIVGDYRKIVSQLGSRAPVPVEVIPFARRPVKQYLESLGARVEERRKSGEPFRTDEDNIILDAYFGTIVDPAELARAIGTRPGVVEHGLFLGLATMAVVASSEGIELLYRG